MEEAKTCQRCGISKPLTEFHVSKNHPGQKHPWCKPCKRASNRAWHEAHPERSKELAERFRANNPEYSLSQKSRDGRRDSQLRFLYGIDLVQYRTMFADQNGSCAICETTERKLSVDHSHHTGRVRALLCQKCNLLVGFAESAFLHKAVAYVARYKLEDQELL